MEAMRKSWTDERLDGLSETVEQGFADVDAQFEKVDAQFEKVDAQFDKVDERFERVDERLDEISDRLKRLEQTTVSTNLVIIAGLFGVIATQI